MNPLVAEANRILSGQGFDYAICGGQAVDLFLGYESRRHADLDVLAYWTERNQVIQFMQARGFQVFEMLGDGRAHLISDIAQQRCVKRNIFCVLDDCELVKTSATEEHGVFRIDFLPTGQTKLNFVEFIFNDKDGRSFLYARNHDIQRSLDKAILNRDSIPYLAPELCLLYKSTDTEREGYQHDYDACIAKMDDEQRAWLRRVLELLYPQGHKWLK